MERGEGGIFGRYVKKEWGNMGFGLDVGEGRVRGLEERDWCEGGYNGGRGRYGLKEKGWGENWRVKVWVLGSVREEMGVWEVWGCGGGEKGEGNRGSL